MDWASVGKVAVKAITVLSVNKVVMNVVKATTPPITTFPQRVMIGIGSFVISSMITDHASVYVLNEIDAIFKNAEEEKKVPPNSAITVICQEKPTEELED